MKRSKERAAVAGDVALRLFVTGTSQRSARAIEAVQSMCQEYFVNGVHLDIIDVLEDPDQAESERIVATPTLIRQSPGPARRLIGDLVDSAHMIQLLGLKDQVQAKEKE